MGLHLCVFVDIKTLPLMQYFFYNLNDATNTIVMHSEFKADLNTVCALLLYDQKVFGCTVWSRLHC